MKDPIAALSAEWLAETFHMEVLCLVRHPAALVDSLKRVGWRFDFTHLLDQPSLMEEWLHPWADQMARPPDGIVQEGALLWLCIYYVLSGYLRRHPEWLCWRLEDISVDPDLAFKTIYHRLGLPYTFCVRRRLMAFSAATNPAQAPPGEPHHIKRDSQAAQNQWRTDLSPKEVAQVRRIVEPVASSYYSDADW
jgi:hypothetical protein